MPLIFDVKRIQCIIFYFFTNCSMTWQCIKLIEISKTTFYEVYCLNIIGKPTYKGAYSYKIKVTNAEY